MQSKRARTKELEEVRTCLISCSGKSDKSFIDSTPAGNPVSIIEKSMLLINAFDEASKLKNLRKDKNYISNQNEIVNYLLSNYFIQNPKYIDKINDFMVFVYPDLNLDFFQDLNDETIEKGLNILAESRLKIKNTRTCLKDNLDKATNEITRILFDYLVQYVLQKSDTKDEFKQQLGKVHAKFEQGFFDQFINYFRNKLANVEEKYPEKTICVGMLLKEIDWAIQQIQDKT